MRFALKPICLSFLLACTTLAMVGCGSGPYKPESVAGAPTPAPTLPTKFQITEKAFTWGATFDVKSAQGSHGKITEKVFSWGRTFRYEDSAGRLVATAHAKPFSWGVHIDVYDSTGAVIGTIKEDIYKNLFSLTTTYHILNRTGEEVATSKKYEMFSTDISLTNPQTGHLIANLHRGAFQLWTDTWDITQHNVQGVDSRLLVMISAFKTAEDNAKSHDD